MGTLISALYMMVLGSSSMRSRDPPGALSETLKMWGLGVPLSASENVEVSSGIWGNENGTISPTNTNLYRG
ncbi:MAG: hypothetical protein QXH74_02585 [Sulfolobales archaeon]